MKQFYTHQFTRKWCSIIKWFREVLQNFILEVGSFFIYENLYINSINYLPHVGM